MRKIEKSKDGRVMWFETSKGQVMMLRVVDDALELTPQSKHRMLQLTTGRYGEIRVEIT